MHLIALHEQSSEVCLLLFVSPKNDGSAVFAEAKVAFGFFWFFFVDLAITASLWTFHFLFSPSCSGVGFSFRQRVVWERSEVGASPSHLLSILCG
jgi:hypothetical protein